MTLVKDGKKLVTSRVRQSVGTRQLGRELWAKRMATDRAVVMAKKSSSNHDKEGGAGGKGEHAAGGEKRAGGKRRGEGGGGKDGIAPKVSLELAADPMGVGFAFGGVYPGTLHAHGKLVETHSVSYSVGIVGEYLLHVRLRQQAAALPGSPFRLRVLPNVAHARSCRLPEVRGGVVGMVGTGNGAGTSITFATYDLIGNRCIQGQYFVPPPARPSPLLHHHPSSLLTLLSMRLTSLQHPHPNTQPPPCLAPAPPPPTN